MSFSVSMQSTRETYFNKQHAFLLKKKDDKKCLIFNINQPMNAKSKGQNICVTI